jgi:hypothetical protein
VAVDFASIFDTELERLLVRHKDVTDIHLGDRELSLGAFTLTSEVERETLLIASHVGESRARVVVGALWAERHAAGHFRVWPDLALEGLNLEDFVLEQHFVLLNSFPDAHVFAVESGDGALLAPLEFRLSLGGIVGIVTVEVAVVFVVLACLDGLLNLVAFFLLFLGELEVKPLLLGLLFHLSGEGPPRELDGHGAFVDDLEVLMGEEGDARGLCVDVALRQVHVVVMRLT